MVSGLVPATSYTFQVKALGAAAGNSAYSPASAAIVPGAPPAPSSVQVAPSDGQIEVAWTPPADAHVAYYVAQTTPGNLTCTTTSSANTECLIIGLPDLTTYTVTVTAVGTNGVSSPASAASAGGSAHGRSAGRPDRCAGDGGRPPRRGQLDGAGDHRRRHHRYSVLATGADGAHACFTPDGTTLTCTVTGLTNLATYQVAVVAVGRAASGNSAPSTAIAVLPASIPERRRTCRRRSGRAASPRPSRRATPAAGC